MLNVINKVIEKEKQNLIPKEKYNLKFYMAMWYDSWLGGDICV